MIFFRFYDFMSQIKKNTNINNKITLVSMLLLFLFFTGCASLEPSLLSQAAWNNDVDKIKALIDSGAIVDEVTASPSDSENFKVYLSSPLDNAVLKGNIEAVKTLLENGADVNLSRYCHALTSGKEIIIPGAPSGYYAFKGSALMLSSLLGNLQISKLLLESGANLNQLTEKGWWQPSNLNEFDALSFSAELGQSESTKLLLKYGADPNRRYENGSKSAYRALQRGRGGQIGYVVTLLEENALEIETNPIYSHFNIEFAELAHIAADYYASSDDKKAIRLYRQAIKFYPQTIRQYAKAYKVWKKSADTGLVESYEHINGRLWKSTIRHVRDTRQSTLHFTEESKVNNGLSLRQTIKESKFLNAYDPEAGGPSGIPTPHYYSYIKYECEDETYLFEYYNRKEELSERNLNLSKRILNCYEENRPDMALTDCVKSASEKNKL